MLLYGDCGFQAVDFGGLVVDSGGFRLIAVDSGFQADRSVFNLESLDPMGYGIFTYNNI